MLCDESIALLLSIGQSLPPGVGECSFSREFFGKGHERCLTLQRDRLKE
jgi:hypothetical protein